MVQPKAADGVSGALLEQRRLALEDVEGLPQPRDLRRAGLLRLLVGGGHLVALFVQLLQLLLYGGELILRGLLVRRGLRDGLVQVLRLLRLVLDVLLLLSSQDLVLFGLLLVLGLGGFLLAGRLREALLEVGQAHLQEADYAAPCALRRAVVRVLGVVFPQNLECRLDAGDAELQVRLDLFVVLLLLVAYFVQLGLGRHDLLQLLLQRSNLLLQLRRLGAVRVDLRGKLLDLQGPLVFLLASVLELFITIRLVRGVRLGLLLKLVNHGGDEALDLGEDVLLRAAAVAQEGGHPARQLRERGRLVLLRQRANELHRLEMAVLHVGMELHKGLVGRVRRRRRGILEHLLCVSDGLQLLAAAPGLRLELLRLGHAVRVELPERLDVLVEILCGDLEVSLGRGLLLARGRDAPLRLRQLLLVVHDRVLDGLPQQLELVQRHGLLVLGVAQLRLGLLQQTRQRVHDAPAVALVDLSVRGAHVLRVVLDQGGKALGVRTAQRGGLHHGAEGLLQVVRARLHQGGAVLLQDADRAVEDVDGLVQVLLLCREVRGLGLADVGGRLQVLLVHLELACELLQSAGEGLDDGGFLADRRLELTDLRLASLDLKVQVLVALLAPLREFLVHLLGLFALRDDLGLEAADHFQHLPDRGRRLGERGGRAARQRRQEERRGS